MRDRVVQPAPAPTKQAKDGADGLSAFELARKGGYRGTLDQWLVSLKGAPGDRGLRGLSGKDGDDGRDLALVPAMAAFERDEQTKLTQRVVLSAEDGSILATITPIRDADDFMVRAFIQPTVSAAG